MAVAIRGYAPVAARPDELVIEFARGRYPAYAWAFPVAGGRANVGFGVFDRRGGGSRRELLAALSALLPGQQPDPATIRGHHLPLSTGPRHHPDGRVLLVGDAAALVNPLTGEGIYDAVASGALAGRAALLGLDGGDAGRAHRAAMRRAFGRHRSHLAVLARLVPHARFLDAAVAAAARDPAVFDAAVDLGLAGGTADWHAVGSRRSTRLRHGSASSAHGGQRVLASGSLPSTSMLSTSEFTHCVRGNAPVAAPCQPMNTAEGSDCATARAASIDERGPAAVPITTSGGRSAGTGASARPPPVGHGAHATRSAATLLPNSGYVVCHLPGELLDLGGRDPVLRVVAVGGERGVVAAARAEGRDEPVEERRGVARPGRLQRVGERGPRRRLAERHPDRRHRRARAELPPVRGAQRLGAQRGDQRRHRGARVRTERARAAGRAALGERVERGLGRLRPGLRARGLVETRVGRPVQDEPPDRAGVGARPVGERLGAVAGAQRREPRDAEGLAHRLDVVGRGLAGEAAELTVQRDVAGLHHRTGPLQQEGGVRRGRVGVRRARCARTGRRSRGCRCPRPRRSTPDDRELGEQVRRHLRGHPHGPPRRRVGGGVAHHEQRRAARRAVCGPARPPCPARTTPSVTVPSAGWAGSSGTVSVPQSARSTRSVGIGTSRLPSELGVQSLRGRLARPASGTGSGTGAPGGAGGAGGRSARTATGGRVDGPTVQLASSPTATRAPRRAPTARRRAGRATGVTVQDGRCDWGEPRSRDPGRRLRALQLQPHRHGQRGQVERRAGGGQHLAVQTREHRRGRRRRRPARG